MNIFQIFDTKETEQLFEAKVGKLKSQLGRDRFTQKIRQVFWDLNTYITSDQVETIFNQVTQKYI